jgi:signal transduction histidine kinase
MVAAVLAALGMALAVLWQRPRAELVLFHAVWIALALVAMRVSFDRPRVLVWMCLLVGAMAVVTEIDDLRTHHASVETLVELLLDLPAFVAVILFARRQARLLEAEHENAVLEQYRYERQREFFANAAHALRTPITIARGHTELALQNSVDPAVQADLTVALDELDRLTRAAARSLRLSAVGEIDRHSFQSVDTSALVLATVERWKPTAPRDWSSQTPRERVAVLGDSEQLIEALDAMIENAVLATRAGDSIVVRSEVSADDVVLSVIDDGCGIDGIDPAQLFEPYEQGPRHVARSSGGTGLGLAVVRAVAVAHGGRATIESTAGEGTTVRIILPKSMDRDDASSG